MTRLWKTTEGMMAAALLLLTGCGDVGGGGGGPPNNTGDPGSSSTGTSGGLGGSSTSGGPAPTTGETSDTGTSDGETSGSTDGCGPFLCKPDGGPGGEECDIWGQDCPDGQKCMPWANDGGNSWNATKCSLVNPNPNQVGDPCTTEGGGVSGVDSCDEAMMCWDVDSETGEGVCIEFCTGSPAAPQCANPATNCVIANEGVLILCLPDCDPLLQDCEGDDLCVPVDSGFVCVLDASGEDGIAGDPCDCANCCDAGLFCTSGPQWVAGCIGTDGCCAPFCDLYDPNASASCPGAAGGEECTAWYEPGTEPPGQENIGICVIPM